MARMGPTSVQGMGNPRFPGRGSRSRICPMPTGIRSIGRRYRRRQRVTGNYLCSRELFEESERRHPVREDETIKVERIWGRVLLVGAEDDTLWNTCKYIRRMEKRLSEREHAGTCEALLYEYGTHFLFPESMLKSILPIGTRALIGLAFRSGKEHPKECRETRRDLDRKLSEALAAW